MTFNEYLLHIAGAAFCGIIADIINDACLKKNRSTEKYIKFGITLCIAASVIIPLTILSGYNKSELADIGTSTENNVNFSQSGNRFYILESECEEKVAESILVRTGVALLETDIEIKNENDVPVIKSARVTIKKTDSKQKDEIKEIAEKLLGTETEVVIEE